MSNSVLRAIERGASPAPEDYFGMSTATRAFKTHRIMAIEPNRSRSWNTPPQILYWTKCGLAFWGLSFTNDPDFKHPCQICKVPDSRP